MTRDDYEQAMNVLATCAVAFGTAPLETLREMSLQVEGPAAHAVNIQLLDMIRTFQMSTRALAKTMSIETINRAAHEMDAATREWKRTRAHADNES